jgi:hypothetical protein
MKYQRKKDWKDSGTTFIRIFSRMVLGTKEIHTLFPLLPGRGESGRDHLELIWKLL